MRDALGRVAELISRDDAGWTVAGPGIPAEAPSLDPVEPIAEALYDRWYTRASDSASLPPPAPAPPGRSLLGVLRAAHAGAESTETGWVVIAVDPGGRVTAVREGRTRTLRPGEYLLRTRPGAPPAPGEPVEAMARWDHLDVERGLWWTHSEVPPDAPLGRVYLNSRPATLPGVVHETTAALLPTGLSFQLKCPEFAAAAARTDAMVAYHRRSDRQPFLAALLDHWPSLEPLLDPDVPPFTRVVRPGLSWADDPGGDQSFGQSRCRALARAVVTAGDGWPAADLDARCALLAEGLRAAGIDPGQPWKRHDPRVSLRRPDDRGRHADCR